VTDFRQVGFRIESLLEELRGSADPAVRERTEELVKLLVELYGEGLRLVLEAVHASPDAEETLDRMRKDPLVASLLVLHGLHPTPARERIEAALAAFRPSLDVRLVDASESSDGRIRVQVRVRARENAPASSSGCASSASAVRETIERAVRGAAPEIAAVDFEEGPTPLVQIEATGSQVSR
jgi:hypothetical protein